MPKKPNRTISAVQLKKEHKVSFASYRKNVEAQLKRDLEDCPKGISKKYLASLTAIERKNVLAGLAFDGSAGGGVTMEQSIQVLLSLPKRLRSQNDGENQKQDAAKKSEVDITFQYFVDAHPTGRKRFVAAMKIANKRLKKHP